MEQHTLDFHPLLPVWALTLIVVILTGLAAYYAWYLSRIVRPVRSVALVLLRAAFFAGLFGLLVRPTLVLSRLKPVKATLVVAVDRSSSMNLPAIGDAQDEQAAGRRRADRVWAWLSDPTFQERLGTYQVKRVTFGSGVEESSGFTKSGIEPFDETTDFRELLGRLAAWVEREPVTGVILFSDGVDHSDARSAIKSSFPWAPERNVPILAVGFPAPTRLRDLSVEDVEAGEFAFVRSPMKIRATIQVKGFDLKEIPVTLKKDGEIYTAVSIPIDRKTGRGEAEFEIQPVATGPFIYSVSVPVYEGESVTRNNERRFAVRVMRDKTRVLLISGRPSWELRFFRDMIKRHPHFDLVNFNILRTPSDIFAVPEKELSLIPFPSDDLFFKDIRDFDVLVFVDFTHETLPNFAPYIRSEALAKVREQVEKEGLGLLIVGGEQTFAGSTLRNSPLEPIFPVNLPMVNRGVHPEPFVPTVPVAARSHFILRSTDDQPVTWDQAPPLTGTAWLGPPKPGAVPLMVHPKLRVGGEPVPVLTVWEKGKGRVLTTSTDSFWRWAFTDARSAGPTSLYYNLWYRAIRWLTRDPESDRVRVTAERTSRRATEVNVGVFDESYRPARGARVRVRLVDPEGGAHEERAEEVGEGAYRAAFASPPSEVYRVEVEATDGERGVGSSTEVFSDPGALTELRDFVPDQAFMEALASRTGGRWIHAETSGPEDLAWPPVEKYVEEGSERRAVWNTLSSLLVLVCAAAGEWALRRRWGLM